MVLLAIAPTTAAPIAQANRIALAASGELNDFLATAHFLQIDAHTRSDSGGWFASEDILFLICSFFQATILLLVFRVWRGGIMVRLPVVGALAASLLVAGASAVCSQEARQNEAGQFDFYVLSLSWSPSFCAASAERHNGGTPSLQCGARPYSFVVHGLWPQYVKGFPEYCQVPSPRLYHGIVSSMLDLMPAPRLVYNEWDKHGTCSGLAPRDVFRHRAQGARGCEYSSGISST